VVQGPFDPGVFEFGVVRSFEGLIQEGPYPMLLVERPGDSGDAAVSDFFLVRVGKHGAADEVAGLDGRQVRLEGSLIYREGKTMIEVVGGSVEPLGDPTRRPRGSEDLGIQTLSGEIVDSKCFFGVMKPGHGKPHRACATVCIVGGVPPVLRVEAENGDYRHFLLVDERGRRVNDRVLEWIGEPIEITGEVSRNGDLLILSADPGTYRRF